MLPGKGEGFIFLVAGISLVAVMLGVAALIIVMSVMNGFRAELFDKVVGLNGHAVIQGYGGRLENWRPILDQARATPGVTSADALIEQPLMATNEGRVEAILLRGVPRDDIVANPTLNRNVIAGSLEALRPAAIMSRSARASPRHWASASEVRSPSSPAGPKHALGTVPRIVDYRVAGIFEVGLSISTRHSSSCRSRRRRISHARRCGRLIEVQTEDADRVREILAPLEASLVGGPR